jgi:glyoxylase-like metal-dependent hydrolase (beta-lactamase superfamily II)
VSELQADPGTEKVRDGLWSIAVPIPNSPLGYTLVYLFETARGPVLVDAGWDDDASWDRLSDGIATAGYSVADTFGVLVTHMHLDHHGLSGRVKAASDCWVAMHPLDAAMVERVAQAGAEYRDELGAVLLDAGAPEEEIAATAADGPKRRSRSHPVAPDRHIDDGDLVDVPGWSVHAVWTPGHSPGHVCFRVPDHGLLLAGDHVLPSITPHIALSRSNRSGDPLGEFLASLAKVDTPDIELVLPAHEHRFAPLHDRVAAITSHHHSHLAALQERLASGPSSLWDLAQHLEWNRPWDELNLWMKRAAVNETAAHLRHLMVRGLVRRWRGVRPLTFELEPSTPPPTPEGPAGRP